MKKVKSVIIEDIPDNRDALKKLLAQECPNVEIIGEAESIDEGEKLILEQSPELVFMDIELKGATSFDLLENLQKKDALTFEIIFFTAYGTYEYATRAIEFSALEFLTKPIDAEKLRPAVEKAVKKLDRHYDNAQIKLMLEILRSTNQKTSRIAFHLTKGIVEFVNVQDIVYLEADGPVTYVHLKDNSKLTAVKNLGQYSKLLTRDFPFFPISNSILINLDYVRRYNHSELSVVLTTGNHLFASRRGGQEFRRYLNENRSKFGDLESFSLGALFRKLFGR